MRDSQKATRFARGLFAALGIKTMELHVYEWLKQEEYARWVCPHMTQLLGELARHGNTIKAVGLVNPKSPEAVIFVADPLPESDIKSVVSASPKLQLVHNGIGKLHGVSCSEHYVTMEQLVRPV